MAIPPSATVDTRVQAYQHMEAQWRLPLTLFRGTWAMRAARERFLPKNTAESTASYDARLARTFLYNHYRHAITTLRGKVFDTPIALHDDSPGIAEDWSKDIDLQGMTLNEFAFDLFMHSINFGKGHFIVDFPRVAASVSEVVTMADVAAQNARPYFTMVLPNQITGWRYEYRGGRQVLSQLRIHEQFVEPDGEFGERLVDQYRVWYPGQVDVYRRVEGDSGQYAFRPDLSSSYDLPFIPLVSMYTFRTGLLTAEPALNDLAQLNLEHWQHSSMQQIALHASRMLLLHAAGFPPVCVDTETGQTVDGYRAIELGMHQMVTSNDPNSKLTYVAFPPAAIENGEKHLTSLVDHMTVLSMAPLLRKTPGTPSATGDALRTAQQQSILWSWAWALNQALDTGFEIARLWTNQREAGRAVVNTDFGIPFESTAELDMLYKSVISRVISRDQFLDELKRRNILSDSYDKERDKAILEQEDDQFGSFDGEVTPPPNQPAIAA